MTSNPYETGGMSVTLKQDGKDGTWTVFHGTPTKIREQLLDAFGWSDATEYQTMLLPDLIHEATKLYKGTGNAIRTLGARTIKEEKPSSDGSSGGNAWSKVASQGAPADSGPSKEEQLQQQLLAQIEEVPTVTALKELWARNQAAFKAPELMDAYRTKGGALKAAGAL